MAFVRKRGGTYYLVHNVRKGEQVEQLHLATLGRWPRITDDVIKGVNAKHPFLQLDWKRLTQKASSDLEQPLQNNSQYLRDLVAAVRNLHFDLADLPLPVLDFAKEPELSAEFIAGLKLLRGTLDVKLNQLRRVKGVPYRT
ncbi:MAG: hypothetical protein ABSH52_10720 [Terriglobia bacterium]|jgi:hypothetical protein